MVQIKPINKIVFIMILISYFNVYAQSSKVSYYKNFDIFKMKGLQPISMLDNLPYIKFEQLTDSIFKITTVTWVSQTLQQKAYKELIFIRRDSCYYMEKDTMKTEDPYLNIITSGIITPIRIIIAKNGLNIKSKSIDSENLQEFYPSLKSVSSTPCGKGVDKTIITPKINITDSTKYGKFCDIQYISYVPMKNHLLIKKTMYLMMGTKEKKDGKVVYGTYTAKEIEDEKLYYKNKLYGTIANFSFFWHIFFDEMPWKD